MSFRCIYLFAVASALSAGCAAPRPPLVVTDPDPSVKIPAMKKAVRQKDLIAAKQMVIELESDDPAVRLYAIEGLQRISGDAFGYEYWTSEEQRKPAVVRWNNWLAIQNSQLAEDRK